MGFLVPILFNYCKKFKNTFFIAMLVSVSIELIQLLFNLGSCDIDDLILNVLGSMLGFAFYKILRGKIKSENQISYTK